MIQDDDDVRWNSGNTFSFSQWIAFPQAAQAPWTIHEGTNPA